MITQREQILQNSIENTRLVSCTLCSKQIQLRHLFQHEKEECSYRIITCSHPDCNEQYPAHLLKHHEQFECQSQQIQYKKWLIERARLRSNYPRPWGIDMIFNDNENTQHQQEENGEIDEEGEIKVGEGDEQKNNELKIVDLSENENENEDGKLNSNKNFKSRNSESFNSKDFDDDLEQYL